MNPEQIPPKQDSPSPTTVQPQPEVSSKPPSNYGKLLIIFGIILGLIVLMIVGLIVLYKLDTKDDDPFAQTTTPSNNSSQITTAQNACKLVPVADASQIIGVTLTSDNSLEGANNGEPTGASSGAQTLRTSSTCPYASGDRRVKVDIRSNNPGNANEPDYIKNEYKESKQRNQSMTGFSNVTDLGDDAYWDSESSTLYMLKSDSYYKFSIFDGSPDRAKTKATAERLARTALENM